MEFEPVIGLEVHAQLLTESKIFTSASAKYGNEPNSQVNPYCLGLPGVLPVFNKKALEFAVKAGLATKCEIARESRFARKNYFYPDLPKGYQISQYDMPLCRAGRLNIKCSGYEKEIRITRIHMEEDAGKLIHEDSEVSSYVDLNRAGVPLIEIVSEPDISTAEEAVEYVKKLRNILKYIGVCNGNMQEGSLRCDANISVRPSGSKEYGTKTEVKNINSFRFIQKAIEYEIKRQVNTLNNGGKIVQETRLYDSEKDVTFSMRSKEEAHDYRYFPDPDLLPVLITEEYINGIKNSLPELPDQKLEKFIEEYSLPRQDALILTSSKPLADYFENCIEHYNSPKTAGNWIINELLSVTENEEDIEQFSVKPSGLASLLKLTEEGKISGKIAKDVFSEMISTGKSAERIVQDKNLVQISDESELESIVMKIVEANPEEKQRYEDGENKLLGFFVGQVMKETKGKANPKVVNKILKKFLNG